MAFLCFFVLFFSVNNSYSQVKNEEDLKKQAEKDFENEDYNLAYKQYSQLVSLYPKDPEYNYRLGVCMLFTEPDKKKPFSYLKIATANPKDAPKDAKFYLAKTYHINYKFDEAIKLYNEYKQIASASAVKKLQVDREIEACKNGKRLLSNLSDLVVITKKQLNEADYFRSYELKDIGGKLLVKPDDFRSSIDKKKKEKSIIYLPQVTNRIYFSSYGESNDKGRDIYFVSKLPNGSWSKPQAMPPSINTEYDEDYPFLHPNGKTLYFSSKGHNSMGGYDVFKTTFDEATNTWSKPQNLEFPINSPDDDILFVTDSLEKQAYFSTGRYSPYGKIDVLKINTERRPMDFAFLKGTVVKENAAQSLKSKITVKNMENGEIVGTYQAQENGDYSMEIPNGGKFIFTVETPGLPTQSDGVQVPVAYSLKPYKQVISYDKQVLKIINYFDGQIDDENYSVMIDLIEKKAKLEVNENEPYNNNLKNQGNNSNASSNLNSVTTNNPTISSSGNDPKNNTNKNVTNEQLLTLAKEDAKAAKEESDKLKQEAKDAFGLATQKTAEALDLEKTAENAFNEANAISDPSKRAIELEKAENLKEDAKIAKDVANTATNLAKRLEVDADLKQKEADLTNQYISQLENIVKNKNNKESLVKLEQIQKELDEIAKQSSQSNELLASLKAEAVLKQNELANSEKKSESILTEINNIKTEEKTLQTDLANEDDKALKENIAAQIRELNSEIDLKNKELETNKNKIEVLKNEVEGVNKEIEISSKILNEKSDAIVTNTNNVNDGAVITNTNTASENNEPKITVAKLEEKYKSEIVPITSSSSKETIDNQNEILKNYNKEISDLLNVEKENLSKTKDANQKKAINSEIKQLEKLQSNNEKAIASNDRKLKDLNTTLVSVNSNSTANTESVTPINSNTTAAVNSSSITNTSNTNSDNSTAISSKKDDSNNKYLNSLSDIKNSLESNKPSTNTAFDFNNYTESSSLALKAAAKQQLEKSKQDELKLLDLISKSENDIKSISTVNSSSLLNEAENLSNTAFEQRKESVSKTGAEKDNLIKQAIANEKLSIDKKLEASIILERENKNEFSNNTLNLTELVKLTGPKSNDGISQANMLAQEAQLNYKQAEKLREEANSYPQGAARLGGLSNAEEKEAEALAKQKKSIELLLKENPSYKLKGNAEQKTPESILASVNSEVSKLRDSEASSYLSLSKANQNELKLQGDKISKNPKLSQPNYKEALELKLKSDNDNSQAKALLEKAKNEVGLNKANLIIEANKLEISAIENLKQASKLLSSDGTVAINNTTGNNSANTKTVTANGSQNASNTGTVAINNPSGNNSANTKTVTTNGSQNASNTGTVAINNNTGNNSANTKTVATNGNQNASNSGTVAINNNTGNNSANTKTVATNGSENASNTGTVVTNNTSGNNSANTKTVETNGSQNASNSGNDAVSSTNNNGTSVSSPTNNPQSVSNSSSNSIQDDVSSIKSSLNNNAESEFNNFNSFQNSDAIAMKDKALAKINEAINEDKTISNKLEKAEQTSKNTSGSENLSQQQISSLVADAEKLNDDAFKLRQLSVSKTGDEKAKDIEQAKKLEAEAISKKVIASTKQQQFNNALFIANQKSLLELQELAKGKNIAELGTADMQMNEADLFFNKAKNLREEANSYPTDAAKLGGYGNAEEKENEALVKQEALIKIYKKYFSNYVVKQPNLESANPEFVSEINNVKSLVNTNNQKHIDGLTELSKANEQEYKTRMLGLPQTNEAQKTALKTKAQAAFTKSKDLINLSNQTTDLNKKKKLLVEANQNGQNAISLLNQIITNSAVLTNNSGTNNSDSSNNPSTNNSGSSNNSSTNNSGNSNLSSNNTSTNNSTTDINRPTAIKIEGLEVKQTNAYSSTKPIPIDEKIQDGLVFKVQIGAFKQPLPNNTFKGLTPVIAQTTPSGYLRYMAGNFEKYDNANAVKNDLKNLGYNDAFVVAYYNGVRINLTEGLEKAKAAGQTVVANNNVSAGITPNANIPKNNAVQAIVSDNQPVVVTKELEQTNGLLYTIQIGVYSKEVKRSQLFNLKPIYTEKLPSGLYRYTAGIYNQPVKLLEDKSKVVALGVKDAFVSAYYNSKRIPFADGKKLQAENQNLKLEVENPIIFPNSGNQSVTVTNNTSTVSNTNEVITPAVNNAVSVPTSNNSTSVKPFNNGVTSGPTPTADNGVKADEAGISYKVQIGAYKNQVPNDVAAKFLNIKTWPVNNVVINGLYIYTIGNFTGVSFAKKLRDEAVSIGITDAYITVYKDGKKLYGNEATQYLSK